MKIIEKGFDRYAEVKITTCRYCQACEKDFEGPELVFYSIWDNNIICKECAKAHALKEPRIYVGEAD